MMSKQAPSFNSSQQGFTLLELMVVLVIIGSLLGMVTVAYQVDDDEEAVQEVGQSARLFLQHQIDQSWLDGETLGAKVSAQEITISSFKLDNETWEITESSWVPSAEQVEVSLVLAESDEDNEIEKSSLARDVDIAFVSSGEYSPFELRISVIDGASDTKSYLLKGDGVNALKLSEE